MRILKVVGRVVSWLSCIVLSLLLMCNIYTIAVRSFTDTLQPSVFGWSWAVVISGSMEPEIRINDLVVVQEKENYQIGDIISFKSGNSIVTHRIVGTDVDGYLTQGDANNTPDLAPVAIGQVVGKVMCIVPQIGVLIQYLQTPLGMMCLVLIGFLLIEIPFLVDKRKSEKGGRFL